MSLTRLRNKVGTTLIVHNADRVNMHNFEEKNERTNFGTEPGRPQFRFPAFQLQLLACGSRQGGRGAVPLGIQGPATGIILGQEQAQGRPGWRWGDVMAMVRP